MEAKILQEQCLSRFELGCQLCGNLTDTIRRKRNVFAGAENVIQQFAKPVNDGPQAHYFDTFPLGSPKMGAQDNFCLVPDGIFDCRNRFANAGVVADLPAVSRQGDVKVNSDKNTFVRKI